MSLSSAPEEAGSVGPVDMVVLQGTSFCNLNCSYCYLSEESRRDKSEMSLSTIETVFDKLLSNTYISKELRVSWHSGEPLVLKPSYYRDAMEAILTIKAHKGLSDLRIHFDIQTNGTLIKQEWCDLLLEFRDTFTIGISCDGPSQLHDIHRQNWSGKPTHIQTERGMKLLRENNIKFDITAVVSPESLDFPVQFLGYFSQFTDSVREFHFNLHDEFFIDDNDREIVDPYANKYSSFLRSILNEIAVNEDLKYPRIRNFTSFYNTLFINEGDRPKYDARNMSRPFKTLSIETNGDVTTFYAGLTVDECKDIKNLYGDDKGLIIGNILTDSLEDMAASSKLKRITNDFEISHLACEKECEYYGLCSGGYSLIKYRRYKTFEATETPECFVHVKTFSDTLLNELSENIDT